MMKATLKVCVSRLVAVFDQLNQIFRFLPSRSTSSCSLSDCSNSTTYFSLFFHLNLFNMKRMSFQLSVKAMLFALFMIGGFVGVNNSSAQSTLNGASTSTTSFVDVDQASIIAMDQVTFFHGVIPNYAPGSASLIFAVRRAAYYKSVVSELNAGATVSVALSNSLGAGATLGGDKEAAFTTKNELNDLYAEAIALMKL
jgi:hypothetical protein